MGRMGGLCINLIRHMHNSENVSMNKIRIVCFFKGNAYFFCLLLIQFINIRKRMCVCCFYGVCMYTSLCIHSIIYCKSYIILLYECVYGF